MILPGPQTCPQSYSSNEVRTTGFRKLSTVAPPVDTSSTGGEGYHGQVIEDALSPDANGYIKVGQNEGLLFFDSTLTHFYLPEIPRGGRLFCAFY